MAPTLPISKDWRFTTSHPKELIIGDVSKGETTHSNDFCHVAFISLLNQGTSSMPRVTHIGCLPCQKSSINLSAIKFGILSLDPMIDQQLVLNEFLGTSWMSRVMLLGI